MRDPLEGCFSPKPPPPAVLSATYEEAADGTSTAIVHGSRYHRVPVAGGVQPVDGDLGAIGLTQRHTQRGPVWLGSGKRHVRVRGRASADDWAQGQGNAQLQWTTGKACAPWVLDVEVESIVLRTDDPYGHNSQSPPLGVVSYDGRLAWLLRVEIDGQWRYAVQQTTAQLTEAAWTLPLDPVIPEPADLPQDFRWGWLFYSRPNLVVLAGQRAYEISPLGILVGSIDTGYDLVQCSVWGGRVLKGWHQHRSDAILQSRQDDALIRCWKISGPGSGVAAGWTWNPNRAIPPALTRAEIVSTGALCGLYEGRWPISPAGVAVLHVSGWNKLDPASDSAKLIQQTFAANRSCAQESVSATAAREVWAASVGLKMASGVEAWNQALTLDAVEALLTDAATVEYWDSALTGNPEHGLPIESSYYAPHTDSFPSIIGVKIYGGVAATLAFDRVPSFTYQYYPTGDPADGTATAQGRYQHVIGTPAVFGDPRPESTVLRRPERHFFPVPRIRLLPQPVPHMPTGDLIYPDGETIVDAVSDDDTEQQGHMLIEDDGHVYRIYQRPEIYWLGGPQVLPVFDSDAEVPFGGGVTLQQTWAYYQVGKVAQSFVTILEKRTKSGVLVHEQDISYRFPVVYRGLPL